MHTFITIVAIVGALVVFFAVLAVVCLAIAESGRYNAW